MSPRRAFECQCGKPIFFRNDTCLACQTPLGYDPEAVLLRPLEPAGDRVWRAMPVSGCRQRCADQDLQATSEGVNLGATFTLRLPLVETSAATTPNCQEAERPIAKNVHVLLVEDHVDTAEIMTMALQAEGVKVTLASTFRTAQAALQGNHFDAVISDLGLPDGHGIDLPSVVGPSSPPFLVLSGFGGAEVEERSKLAGFRGHLVKPAAIESVMHFLRTTLTLAPS